MHWYDLPDLLPPVYRNIKSMFATADAENIELQRFRAFVTRIMDNFFVQTCDVQTIEYWEALLDIKLYGNPTLDERREMILLHLNNSDPITDPFVKQVMHNLFGQDNYTFKPTDEHPLAYIVEMYDTDYEHIERFLDWFYKVCPAHIALDVSHIERADGELFVSSISPGQYMARATASVVIGVGSIWLGGTEYSLEMMEL